MSDSKPSPLNSFPLNAWYAAAWGHEIEHALAPRTLCGKDVVLYRRSDGAVAALEDACWHRLLPLSLGRLDGDQVVCGYHGLVFDAGGRCTHMPAQETINPSACVRAYPVVERHRLVWLWMGDPALADPAKIPDFHWNDGTDWVGEGGTFYSLQCDYRLVTDNLMDLTHETYVHAGSIGDDAITRTPFEVTHTDRTVTVERWMENIEPPPFWARQLGRPGHVDRWQVILFQAPSTVVGDVGVALTGTGARGGDRSQGVNGCFLAAITPETATSCHYFWNFVRNYRTDDEALTRQLNLAHVNGGRGVYDQDHAVLEAQQKAIARNPRQPFYNLNIDAGALWARRLIDRMLAAENGGTATPVPRVAAE
jgi:vanillate O-demethylase monooxygenase subunit